MMKEQENVTMSRVVKKDFTYIAAERIYEQIILRSKRKLLFSEKVKKVIFHLHPGYCEKELKHYYIEKIRVVLCIGMMGILLSVGMYLAQKMQSPITNNKIARNAYMEGTQEIEATVTWKGKQEDVVLQVGEQHYTDQELDKLLPEMLTALEQKILGENDSLEYVTMDLNLVETIEKYPFSIEWEHQNYQVMDMQGNLRKENLTANGEVIVLKALLTYDDYFVEHSIPVHVFAESLTPEEQWKKEMDTLLSSSDEKTKYENYFALPETLDDSPLTWSAKRNYNWLIVLILSIIVAIFVYVLKDYDLEKSLHNREEQLLMDYSEMVSKLAIYMGAGMSVRHAWEKIVLDYEKEKRKGKHFVYEEMWITYQEMKSGISEMAAYDRFGKRCNVQIYLKFSTLLMQNLRKGSTGLCTLLREESRLAFVERKNLIRKRGEEAGTKLLLPMMLMLCLVMVMIMLPAFLTF